MAAASIVTVCNIWYNTAFSQVAIALSLIFPSRPWAPNAPNATAKKPLIAAIINNAFIVFLHVKYQKSNIDVSSSFTLISLESLFNKSDGCTTGLVVDCSFCFGCSQYDSSQTSLSK